MVIEVSSLGNLSTDQLVELYKQGHRIPVASNINSINSTLSKVKSLAIGDIGTLDYLFLGLWSYASYKSYKSDHNIWAIIFGALALSTAAGVYTKYKQ